MKASKSPFHRPISTGGWTAGLTVDWLPKPGFEPTHLTLGDPWMYQGQECYLLCQGSLLFNIVHPFLGFYYNFRAQNRQFRSTLLIMFWNISYRISPSPLKLFYYILLLDFEVAQLELFKKARESLFSQNIEICDCQIKYFNS